PAAARLHLTHKEHPNRDEKQHWEPVHEYAKQRGNVLGSGLHIEPDALVMQPLNELRIVGHVSLISLTALQNARNLIAGKRRRPDLAVIDLGQELRVVDTASAGTLRTVLDEIEQCDQQKSDYDPDRQITEVRVHGDDVFP